MKTTKSLLLALTGSLILSVNSAFGGAIVGGFSSTSLGANDDGSTGFVAFGVGGGFSGSLNFLGLNVTGAYLNNNGNMTFDSAMGIFTPFPIVTTGRPIIAPFFGDVDTRGAGSALMTYGFGTFGGHTTFGQTWNGVGYYSGQTNKINKFQTLLVERADISAGDFDIYFNYDQIQWETGGASGGSNGLGGSSARAGISNGSSYTYEFAGSAVNGALIDGGANSLTAGSNVGVNGRYLFEVRNGVVTTPPSTVPDAGSTLVLMGLALVGLGAYRRRIG